MKVIKVKKVLTIIAVVGLSAVALFISWGFGINVGARAERKSIKNLGINDSIINYELEDFEGAWLEYIERKDSISFLNESSNIVYLEIGMDDNGKNILKYRRVFIPIDYKGEKVSTESNWESTTILQNLTYHPDQRSLDFTIHNIIKPEESVSSYFTVGQNANILKMTLKDSINGRIGVHWYLRLPLESDRTYIDLKDGESMSEYARRKLGLTNLKY